MNQITQNNIITVIEDNENDQKKNEISLVKIDYKDNYEKHDNENISKKSEEKNDKTGSNSKYLIL